MIKVFDLLRKIDDKVIGVVNDAYLWALDWTGIYVGTVVFICVAPSFAHWWGHMSHWLSALWLFFLIALTGNMYWMQGTGNKIAFNSYAQVNKDNPLRSFFIWFQISNLIFDLGLRKPPIEFVLDALCFLFWYLICIKIRDRDKKKFEFRLPKFAMERAS
jgi:hypothetical protein